MKVIKLNNPNQKKAVQQKVTQPGQSKNFFTVYPDSASTVKGYIKKLENEVYTLKQSNNEFHREIIILKKSQINLINEMQSIKAQLKNLQMGQTHSKTF